jgi:hypothetical protein
MTALTEDRNTLRQEGIALRVPVADGAEIFIGSLVCINAAGFAVPGDDDAALRFIGVARESADAGAIAVAGELTVLIWIDGEFRFEYEGDLTQADIGYTACIVNDQTVSRSWITINDIPCGIFQKIDDVDTDQVWVQIRPQCACLDIAFALKNFYSVRAASDEHAETGMEAAGVTDSGVQAEDNDNSNTFVSNTTGGTTGNTSGWVTATFDYSRRAHNPTLVAIIRTGADITAQRIWVALCSGAVSGAADPAGVSLIGIRFDTAVPDANWMICAKDGVTLEAVDSGVVVVASTEYKFQANVDATGCSFFIDDAFVGRILNADHLPAAATELGASCVMTTLEMATHVFSDCLFIETHGGVI